MTRKSKPALSVKEQIALYKLQFELAKEMREWLEAYPRPSRLDEGWHGWVSRHDEITKSLRARGWDLSNWNWNPDWDGVLVGRVDALAAVGFEVIRFYRKQKIDLRCPEHVSREFAVHMIVEAVGSTWVGITFNSANRISLWWKGGGPWKTYR